MEGGNEQIIKLTDGGPWGFRLAGGADYGCPLQIAKVRVNSKAYIAGLEEADIITKVDDWDVRLASHGDVMQIVEQGGENITITVIRGAESLDNVYRTFIQPTQDSKTTYNQPRSSAQATLVRSREPSVSRAHVTLGRAPSPARALHILTRSQSRERTFGPRNDGLLNITTSPRDSGQVEYKSFQTEVEPGRLPPTRPGKGLVLFKTPTFPHHRATSLPRTTPGSSITQNIPPVGSADVQSPASSIFQKRPGSGQSVIVPIKPFEMPKRQTETVEFRVRNVNAPKHVWQPNDYGSQQPTSSANAGSYYPNNPYARSPELTGDGQGSKAAAKFYWELMENQPDHMPGYVDPLIVDDTQGDFGGNPIIHPDRDLYSDSNFYKTKDGMFPTIPEQMRLCRMISGILEAPDAMRSRGGKMYHKRKQGSESWAKETMGRKYERPYDGLDAEYSRPYDGMYHWPSTMKENLTVDELERLEHNTENISKHDLLPPVVAFDINSALKNSRNHGKGVDIYRRNAERAEQFTIDENNRKRTSHPNKLDTQLDQFTQYLNSYKSPWKAAWEGNIDRAFAVTDPYAAQSVRDEPELRKDENAHALNYDHQKATFGVKYKSVASVQAPRGPSALGRQLSASTSALDKMGKPEPRLAKMIAARQNENPTFDTYTYKWCMPSYYGKDLTTISADERMAKSQQGSAGWYRRPATNFANSGQHYGSMMELPLRRPKDYIKKHVLQPEEDCFQTRSMSEISLGTTPTLRRPRDFQEEQYNLYQYNSTPLSIVTTPYTSSHDGGSRLATPQHGVSAF